MATSIRDKRVEEIRDERDAGNGYFVYLKPGYQMDGAHCFGEDRVKDIRDTLARVTPCDCDECKQLIAEAASRS